MLRAVAGLALVALAGLSLLSGWPLLSSPSPALADDSSVGGIGGDYYPLTNTDIRMEAETVQAIVYRNFAEYRADFLFVNSGPAQTLMLGFPYALDEPDGSAQGPIAFRAWQDGTPLTVTVGEGSTGDSFEGYYLHQAAFPPGSSMITVSYLGLPSWTASDRFPELAPAEWQTGLPGTAGRYDYWLHTGAGWAGTIGTGVVRYTLADDFRGWGLDVKADYPGIEGGWPETTRPETYTKPDDRTYQWVFRELEPTKADDITLAFTGVATELGAAESVPPALGAVISSMTASDPALTQTGENWALIDGSPASAWGPLAVGGWVQLELAGDRQIAELRIVPGDNETTGSFAAHGRPKSIQVTLSDGTSTVINLADEPSVQKFPIAGTAEWVRLDLLDSYPGTQSADTYISDVSFGNAPAPVFAPFAVLLTQAFAATSSTTAPGSPTTSLSVSTTVPASATTAPGASPTTVPTTPSGTSPTSGVSGGPGTQPTGGATQPSEGGWTVWPIVSLAIAGAALVAVVVLVVLFVRRGRTAKPGPRGPGPAPGPQAGA
jgi:hypothetical protein